jgi:hypothetical protein
MRIDSFRVTAASAAVPESSSAALIAVGGHSCAPSPLEQL